MCGGQPANFPSLRSPPQVPSPSVMRCRRKRRFAGLVVHATNLVLNVVTVPLLHRMRFCVRSRLKLTLAFLMMLSQTASPVYAVISPVGESVSADSICFACPNVNDGGDRGGEAFGESAPTLPVWRDHLVDGAALLALSSRPTCSVRRFRLRAHKHARRSYKSKKMTTSPDGASGNGAVRPRRCSGALTGGGVNRGGPEDAHSRHRHGRGRCGLGGHGLAAVLHGTVEAARHRQLDAPPPGSRRRCPAPTRSGRPCTPPAPRRG